VPLFEPFHALRYNREKVDPALVTAPPYDVIGPTEREELLRRSPHNVVRIDLPIGDDPYTEAANVFSQWKDDEVIEQDDEPSFTVYRMEAIDGDGYRRTTTGVIGALQLSRPGEGDILPHEFTTPKAKSDRLDLLRSTNTNLSPVWGLSPSLALTELLTTAAAPWCDFSADDVHHTLWKITDPDRVALIQKAVSEHPVVIADGHHRYETSLQYRDEQNGRGGTGSVMAFIVELAPEELWVGPIHRLITNIDASVSIEDWLNEFFQVQPFDYQGVGTIARLQKMGALAAVLPDRMLALVPRPEKMEGVRDLDSQRLDTALAALGNATVTYQHGIDNIRYAVANGDAQLGVLLRPVTVEQIVDIANGGERMPPKSTFFEPKPRTGLVFRDLA